MTKESDFERSSNASHHSKSKWSESVKKGSISQEWNIFYVKNLHFFNPRYIIK